jgi:hypothetical protein
MLQEFLLQGSEIKVKGIQYDDLIEEELLKTQCSRKEVVQEDLMSVLFN